MIDLPLLLAFIVAATILTVTPGVDTAMVLRAATVDGRRAAVLAALGISLGCLVWGAAVALGLGALLQASELAYTIVKLVGAGYLIWLGARALLKPRRTLEPTAGAVRSTNRLEAFWGGLATNLLNPKIGVFFVTFLPQFVPHGAGVAGYSFLLACIYVMLALVWFAILIAATVPLARLLRKPGAVTLMDRLTGGVFVAFGLKLATSTTAR